MTFGVTFVTVNDHYKKNFTIHFPVTIPAFSVNVTHGTSFHGPRSYPWKISPDYSEIWKMRTSVRGKGKMDYGLWNAPVRTDPDVSHMNESCHTCEWLVSHVCTPDTDIRMSHVIRMDESCHTYG